MYFKEDARITDEGYLKTYNIFKVGDIAFEGNKSSDFSHGRFVENTIGDGIVSHVFVVFRPLHNTHNLKYWKYAINNESVMGRILARCTKKTTMMTNLVAKDFLNQTILCPSAKEQDKIASLLDTISKRIELQKLYVGSLKKYKRGVFEAIFSRKLRLIPKTRQSDWTAFKLGDFATRITRKNNGATDIPLTISAQYGLIDQRNFFSKVVASSDMSGYYLLRKGEYAYNRSTSNDYPFGSIKRLELYDEGAVSTLYLCFAIKEDIVLSNFAKWYFESSQWHRGINEICAEGARNHGLLNVPTDVFFNTIHIFPSDKEEQARIATFLSRIHDKQTQAQKELEKLKSMRNGLMQQLFI